MICLCVRLGKISQLFFAAVERAESEWTRRMTRGRATQRESQNVSFRLFHSGLSRKTHQHLRTTLQEGAKNTKTKRKLRDGHTLLEMSSCWCCIIISKIKNHQQMPGGHIAVTSCRLPACRSQGQKNPTSSMFERYGASIFHSCFAALLVSQGRITHQGLAVWKIISITCWMWPARGEPEWRDLVNELLIPICGAIRCLNDKLSEKRGWGFRAV